MSNPINIAQAYHIAGNQCEAWLLQSLFYWQTKATIEKHHKKWVIRTAREFVEEHGFPFNTETISKGLRALRRKNLIETMVAPHAAKPGILRATWIRVSDEAYSQVIPIEDIFQSRSKLENHTAEETSAETSEEDSTEFHSGSSAPAGSSSSVSGEFALGEKSIDLAKKGKNTKENAKLGPKGLYDFFRQCQIETKHVHVPMPGVMSTDSFHKCRKILSRFKKFGVYESDQIRNIVAFAVGYWHSSKADTCRLEDLFDELGDVLNKYACWTGKNKTIEADIQVISPEDLTFD